MFEYILVCGTHSSSSTLCILCLSSVTSVLWAGVVGLESRSENESLILIVLRLPLVVAPSCGRMGEVGWEGVRRGF